MSPILTVKLDTFPVMLLRSEETLINIRINGWWTLVVLTTCLHILKILFYVKTINGIVRQLTVTLCLFLDQEQL